MRVLDKTKKYTFRVNCIYDYADLVINHGSDYHDDIYFARSMFPEGFPTGNVTGEVEVIDCSKQARYDILRIIPQSGSSFCILRYQHYKKLMVSSPDYTKEFLRQLVIPRGRDVVFTVKRPSIWGEEEDHWEFRGDVTPSNTRWTCFLNGKPFMGGALLCKTSWQSLLIGHYEGVLTM